MMFKLIVKHLNILKHAPFLALWVDAVMMIWNIIFRPDIGRAIEQIENEVSTWQGITVTLHKFGGLQFNYGTKELGHIHSNGILDILFTRKIKHDLISNGLTSNHHVLATSGWTSLYIKSTNDVKKALYLLTLSYQRALDKN